MLNWREMKRLWGKSEQLLEVLSLWVGLTHTKWAAGSGRAGLGGKRRLVVGSRGRWQSQWGRGWCSCTVTTKVKKNNNFFASVIRTFTDLRAHGKKTHLFLSCSQSLVQELQSECCPPDSPRWASSTRLPQVQLSFSCTAFICQSHLHQEDASLAKSLQRECLISWVSLSCVFGYPAGEEGEDNVSNKAWASNVRPLPEDGEHHSHNIN